jgi:hypothetical protein
MKEAIAKALLEHHPKFSINYDAGFGKVWECSHLDCHAKGTLEHIVDHQADEVAYAVYRWQDSRIR